MFGRKVGRVWGDKKIRMHTFLRKGGGQTKSGCKCFGRKVGGARCVYVLAANDVQLINQSWNSLVSCSWRAEHNNNNNVLFLEGKSNLFSLFGKSLDSKTVDMEKKLAALEFDVEEKKKKLTLLEGER